MPVSLPAHPWDGPGGPPFSFRYKGKPSAELLPKWKIKDTTGKGAEFRRTTYTDKHSKLQVTAEVRFFPDFPDTVEWVLRFQNIDKKKDTDIVEDILPLDWTTAAAPGTVTVHHARGSAANAHDFEPLEDRFAPGGSAHLASSDGRSSGGATLPFFNLENGAGGWIGAVGWSGNWKADFSEAPEGQALRLSAGMQHTHLRLHPGEEIRTPRIVLMHWSGVHWEEAQNVWRRLVLAHYTPQEHGQPLRGPVMFGDGGSVPLATHLAAIRWVHEHALPVDMYSVDAGWYGNSLANDDTLAQSWWGNRGNWYASPKFYPEGLKPLGDAARAAGLGFSLWIEPEAAMPGTQIVNQHPDWFLHATDNRAAAVLLDLGNPAARIAMTDLISRFITEFGMTWYRQDSNTALTDFWRLADKPDRVGMTEIQHIEGLYTMLDELLARHPGLHIDNCASGGRRMDLEMMSRSFAVWRTDYGYNDTAAVQAQTQALAPWVPETSGTEAYALTGPWTRPGPYSTPRSRYLLRLAYSAGLTVGTGAGTANPLWNAHVQGEIAEYREVQPYIYGDFYALQPYSLDETAWTAWQWDRPGYADGVVVLLRRPKSSAQSLDLNLRHLDPSAEYSVEIRRTYARVAPARMTGSALSHLRVQLDAAPDSALVFYRKLSR